MRMRDLRLEFRGVVTASGCRLTRLLQERFGCRLRTVTLRIGWERVSLHVQYQRNFLVPHGSNQHKGSIGNLASAATVAASSLEMKFRDPHEFLNVIDLNRWNHLRGSSSATESTETNPIYVEPNGSTVTETISSKQPNEISELESSETLDTASTNDVMPGKIQRLGDFIDTDAVG